jgi:hypothetical protein
MDAYLGYLQPQLHIIVLHVLRGFKDGHRPLPLAGAPVRGGIIGNG